MSDHCSDNDKKASASKNTDSPKLNDSSICCNLNESTTRSHSTRSPKIDWLLWGSSGVVLLLIICGVFSQPLASYGQNLGFELTWLRIMAETTVEMLHAMWWGVALGIVAVGWLNRIPRDVVISVLGPGHTKRGVLRATLAGLMLDLCNHGILMIAMKLYERGASLGQVMAFLIASPWNSFTLTLILIGLIGLPLTLVFIIFSMLIAWVSGLIFDKLEIWGTLPMNPNHSALPQNFRLSSTLKNLIKSADYSFQATVAMLWAGLKGARMIIRWLMFGIVLVALIRAFIPSESFSGWFGASVTGLFLTLLAATLLEVCSEGSSPIAADLVNRAQAPGNGFTFLMAGASTDYTEIMIIKDTMKSWKIALFLPLITVPQILFLGWIMNSLATG